MPDQPAATMPDCQPLRMYFRKEGDVRWISHRDLMRVVERLCRRAGLAVRRSEGFHPKPKIHFPSALALGIASHGEVLELELTEHVEPSLLPSRLNEHAPQGLVFTRVEVLPAGQPKARVSSMHYRFPIIPSRRDQAAAAIASLLASSAVPVWREGRTAPIDLLASLSSLQLRDDTLCFTLRALQQAAAQPRDVLNALGLSDLEQHGCLLTRFQVEVTP